MHRLATFFVALPFACTRQVRAGAEVSNAELVKFASLFNDELTMDNLDRVQLVSMCQLLNIPPFGTDGFLKKRLRSNLDAIKRVCVCSTAVLQAVEVALRGSADVLLVAWQVGTVARGNPHPVGAPHGWAAGRGPSHVCWHVDTAGRGLSHVCWHADTARHCPPSCKLQDDLMIKAEGLDSLTDDELRTACKARGLRAAYGEGAASYMRKQMQVRRELEAVSCSLLCCRWEHGRLAGKGLFSSKVWHCRLSAQVLPVFACRQHSRT